MRRRKQSYYRRFASYATSTEPESALLDQIRAAITFDQSMRQVDDQSMRQVDELAGYGPGWYGARYGAGTVPSGRRPHLMRGHH